MSSIRLPFGRWCAPSALVLAALVALVLSATVAAEDAKPAAQPGLSPEQQEMLRKWQSIQWQHGPCTAALGTMAEIKVPKGYQITNAAGTRVWSELNGNVPNDRQLGLLMPDETAAPAGAAPADEFVLIFSFDDSGFVKDDDKDKLDANAILSSIRQGNEEANKYRASHGIPPLEVVGWTQPPSYDATTHNLCWIIKGRSAGQDVVNYNTRVLGRHGVMSINMVADPAQITQLIPTAKKLVGDFTYKSGERYAEFRAGDKVAEYGLTALVAGGAAAVALKTGLFAKLGIVFAKFAKAIIVGILALFGAIAKLFTGWRRSSS